MVLDTFFKALQASPLGKTISGETWIFPTIETIHVFAIVMVVGTIVIVDMRLLGLASKDRPVTAISKEYLPWTWGAFALAACSGLLLFTSRAADYMHIAAFSTKFAFMALAGLNMVAFHVITWRSVAAWDRGEPAVGAKVAGALSLVFWALVILFARKVGFSL